MVEVIYLDTWSIFGHYDIRHKRVELSIHLKEFPELHNFVLQHEIKHAEIHEKHGLSWRCFTLDIKDRFKFHNNKRLFQQYRDFQKNIEPKNLKQFAYMFLNLLIGYFTSFFTLISIRHYLTCKNLQKLVFFQVRLLKKSIPYPFVYIFKHRRDGNFWINFLKITSYYVKRLIRSCSQQPTIMINSPMKMFIPVDSLCEVDLIRKNEIYDKLWVVNNSSIVINVGAHVGIFTLKIAKKVSKIIAIEPSRENCLLLERNVSLNHLTNVIPLNFSLSDYNGIGILYHNNSSLSCSFSPLTKKSSSELVKVVTLDALLENLHLTKIDFIKINAEGSEMKILKGAYQTLKTKNPILSIATGNHVPKQNTQIINFLRNIHYLIFEDENGIIHAHKEEI